MKLLVAGGAELDAGKTTFATGLVAETGAVGFKPRAGNDYWYDHADYREAVEQGRLYGKDARRLAAASPGDPDPEDINPLHRLWIPVPGAGTGVLGRQDRAFVVDRVTGQADPPDVDGRITEPRSTARSGQPDPSDLTGRATEPAATARSGQPDAPGRTDRYVTNASLEVPSSASEHLPLEDAIRVESLPEFNDVMAGLHRPALDAVHERIRDTPRAVVESYTDIARPLAGFEPDAVAVVEPRRARIYRGNRYSKACEVASGSATAGRLEEPVDRVVELLDPAATVELPALGSDERTDPHTVSDRYDLAYDALLGAAFE